MILRDPEILSDSLQHASLMQPSNRAQLFSPSACSSKFKQVQAHPSPSLSRLSRNLANDSSGMQYSTRPSMLTRTDSGDPPSSSGRNLVLMFDGTSNSYGNKVGVALLIQVNV